MRRIATLVIACLAVALTGAAVAVASSGNDNRSGDDSTTGTTTTTDTSTTPSADRPRHFDGRVVTVDAAAKTFDLRVRRHHRRFVVTIAVTDTTVYKKLPNGFDSIAVGNRIKATVTTVDGARVATKVANKRGHRRSDDRAGIHHGNGNDDGPGHDAGDDHDGGTGHSSDD